MTNRLRSLFAAAFSQRCRSLAHPRRTTEHGRARLLWQRLAGGARERRSNRSRRKTSVKVRFTAGKLGRQRRPRDRGAQPPRRGRRDGRRDDLRPGTRRRHLREARSGDRRPTSATSCRKPRWATTASASIMQAIGFFYRTDVFQKNGWAPPVVVERPASTRVFCHRSGWSHPERLVLYYTLMMLGGGKPDDVPAGRAQGRRHQGLHRHVRSDRRQDGGEGPARRVRHRHPGASARSLTLAKRGAPAEIRRSQGRRDPAVLRPPP